MTQRCAILMTALVLFCASCSVIYPQTNPCPLEDVGFCQFTHEIERDLQSGNIQGFMQKVDLLDCQQHGGYAYGPVEETFCGTDKWCAPEGVLLGEAACTPYTQAMHKWEEMLHPPVLVRGHIFTLLPDFPMEDSQQLEWPGILIEPFNTNWNVILLTGNESGEWKISKILLHRKTISHTQTHPGIILPWQWPDKIPISTWFGMDIPVEEWHAGSGSGDPTSYGVLENQSIQGCRFRIMNDLNPYLNTHHPGIDFILDQHDGQKLIVNLYTPEGQTSTPLMAFMEVLDKTESRGYDRYRLAYLLIEADDDLAVCTDAVFDLLLTMRPERFPSLPVPQG